VDASSVRTCTVAAAIPATLVVLGHLALDWNGANGFEARRTLAFEHGIALAVILAGVLAAGRIALNLEHRARWPVADSIAVAGTMAVLAHLAWVWRDSSDPTRKFDVTVSHILALVAVCGVTLLARRVEERTLISTSNPANRPPIGGE
jgi:hypothetical protein